MTPQLLATVILPIALALMMLVMGLALVPEDFKRVKRFPRVVALGIGLQMLALPLLAWLVIGLWRPPLEVTAGLIILAVCPGGATSNVISYLSRGDAALSVTLTAIVSLVAPFTIPFLVNLQLPWLGLEAQSFYLPVLPTIMKLALITLVPVALGMTVRHFFPRWCARWEPRLRQISLYAFAALVVLLAHVNWDRLPGLLTVAAGACLSLCLLGMLTAGLTARARGLSGSWQRTLAIEVGVQNAGTAMFVAAALMGRPELAIAPLFYGILMNVPALSLIAQQQWLARREVRVA